MRQLIFAFISPLGFSLALITLIALLKMKRAWLLIPLLTLYLSSIDLISTTLQYTLEKEYPPTDLKSMKPLPFGVVLAGGISRSRAPFDFNLESASDRALHASRLYHAKLIKKILICSGQNIGQSEVENEGVDTIHFLKGLGVSEEDMIRLPRADTTYHESLAIKAYLEKEAPQSQEIYLITSALHMRRALGTVQKRGISATPAATDHNIVKGSITLSSFTPSASSLEATTLLWKEQLGYWYYKAQGYN